MATVSIIESAVGCKNATVEEQNAVVLIKCLWFIEIHVEHPLSESLVPLCHITDEHTTLSRVGLTGSLHVCLHITVESWRSTPFNSLCRGETFWQCEYEDIHICICCTLLFLSVCSHKCLYIIALRTGKRWHWSGTISNIYSLRLVKQYFFQNIANR